MHMHMSFWFGPNIGEFLFKNLKITSAGGLTLLCVILAGLAIAFESLKVHDAKTRARTARERERTSSIPASETANLLAIDLSPPQQPLITRSLKMAKEFCIFILNTSLSYALMLSVMVYNGYIFIAVVIGMGVGYFIFGHYSMKINMENIQARTTNVICTPKCADTESTTSIYDNGASSSYNAINEAPVTVHHHC